MQVICCGLHSVQVGIHNIIYFVGVIIDITVGYEMTTYTTTEGMGFVELCAVITVVAPREVECMPVQMYGET